MAAEETGKYIPMVGGDKTLRVKKRCQCSLKQGKREQFLLWFCNVDTLTTEKLNELKALLSQAENLSRITALNEAKQKFSVITWIPARQKLDCYNMEDKKRNPDERRRGMLLCSWRNLNNKEIEKRKGFQEEKLHELLLDKVKLSISSIYSSPSSCSENNDKLNSFANAIGDSRIRYIVSVT